MKFYIPEKFGAKGDGKTLDTLAVQKAIDACFENGGGRVVFESGKTYYSNSIKLKKNVELHIQKGAVLKAANNLNGYIRPSEIFNTPEYLGIGTPVTAKPAYCFIFGFEADNCSITGEGIIDANGHSFVKRKNQYYVTGDFYPRPTVVYIEKSNHVSFKDFTVTNTSFWSLHLAGCNDVLISQIRILNGLDVANSDGIDIDHCKNARVSSCHIECADDCICLKNTNGNKEYGACENIIISGCTLTSTSAAIKIGTEGVDDFKNIIVDNCIISKSNRGISVQIRDGGNVENVSFSNCIIETRRFSSDWWGTAEPIAVTSFNRDENTVSGTIQNIRFFNITANGENGVLIYSQGNKIQDVSFDNVQITLNKISKWENGLYDLRPGINCGIEKNDNSAFFIKNAENIKISNSKNSWGNICGSYKFAVNGENIKALELIKFSGTSAKSEINKFNFKNVDFTQE